MLRDYGNASVSSSVAGGAAKRSGRNCDLERLGRPQAKRLKTEAAAGRCRTLAAEQSSVSNAAGVELLTPAATPAYAGVAETISSPYSETEEYMLRGYYEDDLVDSRASIESVQYNLYDMTPEELEGASEGNTHDNDHQIGYTAWSGAPAAATNATVYEDSYDIDM
ncbi:hypothetical protein HG536_0G04460 [Torulaspora globosa]|uniref:Uncharacterized protein n=1 Tax=Torulaspora globosa TaxID=48254 RepID=A0A7G3ZM48_9SACH|nr:uncharacterized protein HG536_0G04460 [Torulaspora globosa]QLL34584.1 hypothetical protein HG536_0G04460 [Torulaspora globosa]